MREVTLESAAFLDSAQSAGAGVPRADQRTIVEAFLEACFQDLGKAPRLLDGQDLHEVVGHLLPGHFGRKDPLAAKVGPVLEAYLAFLETRHVVTHSFELKQALEGTLPDFEEAVRSGHVHVHEHAAQQPFVHKGEKVGRNDPCPCGSGKKFKQCCAKLGK
jgi:uncharacterized protein YecA (UPF0149 family)